MSRVPARRSDGPDVLFDALDGYHPSRPAARIEGPADLLPLLEEVAAHIQVLYDLDRVDAVARTNDFFSGGRLWREGADELLRRKLPEDWARIVCHGVEPLWCGETANSGVQAR